MTRDYSQFLPPASPGTPSTKATPARTALQLLGWQPFFAQQCTPDTLAQTPPVRVAEVHRSGLHVLGDDIDMLIPPGPDATVGDWLLLNRDLPANSSVLDRKSLFKRRSPGHDRSFQLISANVDTAFIVTSCNQDFNIARLERYVALAFEAEVDPVILLTKTDLCEDPAPFIDEAKTVSRKVPVIALNALTDEAVETLSGWCSPGQTLAFLGSSGVGKSTLVNALFGEGTAETAAIREDDGRGRHTTTRRQMRFLPNGCAVLDTPGMRELQLADVEQGIAELFDDLTELSQQCRFRDCAHETEPGCAVRAALDAGEIDGKRLERWRKLDAEERHNTASLSQRRASDKAFGKMIRTTLKQKKR